MTHGQSFWHPCGMLARFYRSRRSPLRFDLRLPSVNPSSCSINGQTPEGKASCFSPTLFFTGAGMPSVAAKARATTCGLMAFSTARLIFGITIRSTSSTRCGVGFSTPRATNISAIPCILIPILYGIPGVQVRGIFNFLPLAVIGNDRNINFYPKSKNIRK